MRRNLSFLFTTIGARQCHDWLNRLPRYTVCLSIVAFYSSLAEDLIRGSSFFSVTLYQSVFADNERAGALCKDCKGPLLRWYPLDEVFVFHCCFTLGSGAPTERYSTWILNLAWPALACWDTWKSVAEDKMPEAFATHSLKYELTHEQFMLSYNCQQAAKCGCIA